MKRPWRHALAVVLGSTLSATSSGMTFRAPNPIHRVVTMLQEMQEKVTEEGKREKKLFEQFMCYCENGASDLSSAISAAQTRLPQLEAGVAQSIALKDQLEKELAQHRKDLADARTTVAEATALREKEAATFKKESAALKTNIEGISKAVAALSRGGAASFLQSRAAARLQRLTVDVDMNSADRDLLSNFLASGDADGAPSGEIVGILKQLKESMEKNLAEIKSSEKQRAKGFKEMSVAKEQEMAATQQAIESKLDRIGELGVTIVSLKGDQKDTSESLVRNRQFLADLASSCKTKKGEWEERSNSRTEELVALAETIKLLNDDEARDLFKATLPSASLLQLQVTTKEMKKEALRVLERTKSGDPRLDLVLLKLRHRGGNFGPVIGMIDEMLKVLQKEQGDDEAKKDYCSKEIKKTQDAKKVLDQTASDITKAIEEAKGALQTLTEELAALSQGIAALDKQVAQATETRKEENEDFVKAMAQNNAAKELLGLAKNRLAKFYTPKLYNPTQLLQAEPRSQDDDQDQDQTQDAAEAYSDDSKNSDDEDDGASFVQVSMRTRAGQHFQNSQPETWSGGPQKQGEAHAGVIQMLDMLQADLDKEIQEATVREKNAQAAYERFIRDSTAKRASDARSIADKEGTKAELEVRVQKMTSEKKSAVSEAMAKAEYLGDLKNECDWLLQNFDVRKQARGGEMESLKRAKAVLSGADFSFVQVQSSRTHHLRRSKYSA